jgi:hypothetical protein
MKTTPPDAEGLTETVLHLFELRIFLFCFVFCLMRKRQNYFTDTEKSSGLEAEGLTPKLLFFFFYYLFNTKIIKTNFIALELGFFLLYSLHLSNACLAYC